MADARELVAHLERLTHHTLVTLDAGNMQYSYIGVLLYAANAAVEALVAEFPPTPPAAKPPPTLRRVA